MEAEEAQDAQIVLGNAHSGIADETHTPCFEVGKAADIIVDRAVGCGGESVHREIAALGIRLPVAPETDIRLTAESLHINAQRGDLKWDAGGNDGYSAVLYTGWHRL